MRKRERRSKTELLTFRVDSYIFLHYPGQVRNFISSIIGIGAPGNYYKFMDFDSTARGYAFLGHKYYVTVDYAINEDTLGAESKMPCNASLVCDYDECAYEAVRSPHAQQIPSGVI